MAEETVDAKLDSGDDTLQYFRTMLDIAAVVTPDIRWPDWQDYFCRHYDRERGTDLAALRGDAAMLRAEAQTARQTVIDQTAIKGDVQRGWIDSAGQVAVSTIEAYLQAAGQVAGVLEKTATAAEGVADAVAGAVDKKVQRMTAEFDSAAAKYIWTWVKTAVTAVLEQKVRKRFIEQLSNDIRVFDSIINDATTAIEAAYAKVPDAANGLNVMPTFPTPAFGEIGATDSPGKAPGTTSPGSGTNSPGSGGGYTGGSTGGGGGSTGSGGGVTGGSTAGKTGVTTGTTGATLPTSAMPAASTAGTSPASTTPASATPSTGNPLSGLTGSTGGAGMPSWLSQLVPKIAEQLGLGKDDDTTDGKDSKDGKDGKDDAKSKDGTTSETKDAQGRTVTATLSPDGRTVEVTVTKPDGTEEKATLTVGDDGKLTLDDPAGTSADTKPADTKPAGATPSGNTPGAGSAGTGGTGTTPGGSTGGTSPAGTTPGGTAPGGGGAPGASTASATPSAPSGNESPAAPGAAAAPAPAPAPKSGAPQPAPAMEEPCPPQPQGSGAELAVTVP